MQELTIATLQARAARSMGWQRAGDWPAELPIVDVANEVGEWLYSYSWAHLARPPAYLDLVQGAGYCVLPDDFGRCVDLIGSPAGIATISLQTLAQVAVARREGFGRTTSYVGAFVQQSFEPPGPAGLWRLEVAPVPIASVTAAFILTYYAGWAQAESTSTHVQVPTWLRPLYIHAVCQYLAGYEHDGEAGVAERLASVRVSPLWEAAMERDFSVQQDLGPMLGGSGQTTLDDDEFVIRRTGTAPIVSG